MVTKEQQAKRELEDREKQLQQKEREMILKKQKKDAFR